MILLHRLYANNFKQLNGVSLHFPDQGTILIEGHNEAGKSSLFEAVFFAFYGQTLTSDRDYKLEDLRTYGADVLEVELDFSIDGRRFYVARKVGKNHTVKLICPARNGETETISIRSEVSRRLLEELRLTPDALLNTCFVEQKRLERLEDLNAEARRTTINELLNLRVLTNLEAEFKITKEDRDTLQNLKGRVGIARLDAKLPVFEAAAQNTLRCLHYAQLRHQITQWQQWQQEINAALQQQAEIEQRRAEIAGKLETVAALKTRLSAIHNELNLRVSAWQDAISAHERASGRVEELKAILGSLPEREAQLQEWTTLQEKLSRLEQLEDEATQLDNRLQYEKSQLSRYDQLYEAWQAGQVKLLDIASKLESARQGLAEAEAQLHTRHRANQRANRLNLLLQHLRMHEAIAHEAAQLSKSLSTARAQAAHLPELRARLEGLEVAEQQMRHNEQALRTLQHTEAALTDALQKQMALNSIATRLADLDRRRSETQLQAEAAEQLAIQASRQAIPGLVLAGLGIALILVGKMSGLLASLGLIGLVLLVIAAVTAIRANSCKSSAYSEQAIVQSTRAALEGETRAVEAQLQSLTNYGPTEVATHIEKLSSEKQSATDELQAIQDLPGTLRRLGVAEDIESVRGALQAARSKVAVCEAQEQTIADLVQQQAAKASLSEQEAKQIKVLVEELGLPGETPQDWTTAANNEQVAWQVEVLATPDTILQEAVTGARAALNEIEHQRVRLEDEQARYKAELDAQPRSALIDHLATVEAALEDNGVAQSVLEDVRSALASAGLPTMASALKTQLALTTKQLEDDRSLSLELPIAQQEHARSSEAVAAKAAVCAVAWTTILDEASPATLAEAAARLPQAQRATECLLEEFDAAGLHAADSGLQGENERLNERITKWRHQQEESHHHQKHLMEELGISDFDSTSDAPLAALRESSLELAGVDNNDIEGWEKVWREQQEAVRDNRSRRRAEAQTLRLTDELLQLHIEEQALAQAEKEMAVKRRAGEIVVKTRHSIVSRVMPLTMQNMRQLLPLLTEGRYQDALWDEENNYLAVYDSRAQTFQRKRVFSGGARDQISLALRLAFALATLPGEHNIRPGWLFLDEPLSSFDRARTQALVDLLTRGMIRRHFAQIFLVSHSESFDPRQFDYRLRLESGRIVESSLPETR